MRDHSYTLSISILKADLKLSHIYDYDYKGQPHECEAVLANFMFGNYLLDGNAVGKKSKNWSLPLPCHLLEVSTE